MTTLTEIRAEYERSIPDAYAGGPAARTQAWCRLEAAIQAYADSQSSPTIDSEPATELSEPNKPAHQAAPRKATR
jgi:hypothetical protein